MLSTACYYSKIYNILISFLREKHITNDQNWFNLDR